MKKVFAIVLHYGDDKITQCCIKSITNTKNTFEEIVIVDNSNNFHFSPAKPDNFQYKKIKIIKNKINLGYAGGMNIGIKYALSKNADYIFLLNNDIVFEKEILSKLTKLLEEKKGAGIVAPAIKFIKNRRNIFDLGGTVNKNFGRTKHHEVTEIKGENTRSVDYVSGCSVLIKKEVFENAGLFDDRYFLYYEDVDFCLRTKKTGFKTYVLPSTMVFHNLSESVRKNSSIAIYNQTKSALIFGNKNLGLAKPFNLFFIFCQSFLFLIKTPKSGIYAFRALFDFYKTNFFLYILIFTFFAFLSYHKVLGFAFWKDDWFGIYQKDHFNSFLLHPGGTLEWIVLSKLFGQNTILWQLSGILLRILDSIAIYLMMHKLSKSRLVGFLSGIFFVSTFGGMDAAGWASAHVSGIAIFFVCLSVYFWLKFYENLKNKFYLLYFIFLSLALLADPIRVVPIIILLFFLKIAIFKNKGTKFAIIINRVFYLLLLLNSVFVFWYLNKIEYSGFSLINKILENPYHILNKSYLIGNYWGSLGNLILGWFINIPEDASTGVYNKLYARIAFILLPLIFLFISLFYKFKSRKYLIITFLISWILIFYIPNWIAEPRLSMGGTHRFLNFSTVGFVGLIAYLISLVRYKLSLIVFASFFVLMNIATSNRILTQEESYRSKKLVDSIWEKIDKDYPKNEKNSIFIYRGEEPLKGNMLSLSGSIPLGIKRKIDDPYYFPIVTDNLELIIKLLCFENVTRFQPGKYVIQKSRIPINNIFAWELKNDGSIKNISEVERQRIRKFAEKNCKVLDN